LLIRYTAYLKASSALLPFWSSVKMAPVTTQPATRHQMLQLQMRFKSILAVALNLFVRVPPPDIIFY
jgi:hypothetical protein